jgi:tRNA pseudouridine55 synthase
MKSSVHGLLVIDKPRGMSSREAVNGVQSWFPAGTRIGHTGTLDPLATGVLVLCLGKATRLAEYVREQTKVYHTRIRLGARSDSADAEGDITPVNVTAVPEESDVRRSLAHFTGRIEQVPPAFSAIKVAGQRAYKLARRGHDPPLKARPVQVDRIDLLAYAYPQLEIQVSCGEGTYIRSLARDIGERLGCGGYVETLRRLKVGSFGVEDALTLDARAEAAWARLLPLGAAFDGPTLTLDDDSIRKLQQGQSIVTPASEAETCAPGERMAVFARDGELAAICAAERDGERSVLLRPLKVIPRSPERIC